MTCSDLKKEMRHLRREVKALKREFHYLICTSVQEESNPGDSERSFKSLPAPEAPGKAQTDKESEPAQELGKRKKKRKRNRGKEEEETKPEDVGHEKDMDPSLCNDLEVDESADSESDSVAASFLGPMPLRSDRASGSDPEPLEEDTESNSALAAPTATELSEMLSQNWECKRNRKAKSKGKGRGGKADSQHNCGTGPGCCKWNKQLYRGPH